MKKKIALLASAMLIAIPAVAQSTPTPAVEPPAAPAYQDNVRPLSGVQEFDVGTRSEHMNALRSTFLFSEAYGTNPGLVYNPTGDAVWGSTTSIGGNFQLERGRAERLFSASYRGAGQINSYNSDLNSQIHTFDLHQTLVAGRWSVLLGNTFVYQPNAYAANASLLFPGNNTGGETDLRAGVGPNNSILTNQATQLTDTAVGQVTYGLSRATSVTGAFSYGVLHYLDGGFLNNREIGAIGGFEHRFRRNTFGVAYTYTRFTYDDVNADFETNTIHVTYGRRLIGRLAIALGVGPVFTTSSVRPSETGVGARASLRYEGNRTASNLEYLRTVTGGSGVTAGANTDSVVGTVNRSLTRTLDWSVSAGFSRNTSNDVGTEFNTTFVSTGISRTLGKNFSISLGYKGQRQTSNVPTARLSANSAVVTIVWHPRPIRIK